MIRNLLSCVFLTASILLAHESSAQVTMNIDASQRGPVISPYQYGLFFEEINHAGDGGLYAELVRNRSFENSDKPDYWATVGKGADISVVSSDLLNTAQHHALKVKVSGATAITPQGISNEGFWGMAFKTDSTYTLTFFVKSLSGKAARRITARLVSADGKTLCGEAKTEGKLNKNGWTKLSAKIKATANADKGELQLVTSADGEMLVDVVSLFPYTWKGRTNGMRPDLAQLLADTHPRFLRFPGGCYVEGNKSFNNAFQWKRTLGPIEQRPGHLNANWGYYSSDGLGFDEYLQLCNDLKAQPMFVVSVGLGHGFTVPLADVDTLVQNTLDAIEYANGDASTTWGARRIANGHPEPYGLKFIEIGNENYQVSGSESVDYPERYYKFYKAIKERFPEIICIGNVEAWGTDNPSWRNAHPVEVVDEHYYRSFGWMQANYAKYDAYPRQPKVYVGEYAANAGGSYGTYGNVNSALGEAVFMMGMEKNSDVCVMGSFAPIFMNEKDATWGYDMIHYNAAGNFCTPSYYVQKMMGMNTSGQNVRFTETGNSASDVLVANPSKLVYMSAQIDDSKNQMVLKVVNPQVSQVELKLNLKDINVADGTVIRLASEYGTDENTMEKPFNVVPSKPEKVADSSTLTMPPFSFSIFRWDIK